MLSLFYDYQVGIILRMHKWLNMKFYNAQVNKSDKERKDHISKCEEETNNFLASL